MPEKSGKMTRDKSKKYKPKSRLVGLSHLLFNARLNVEQRFIIQYTELTKWNKLKQGKTTKVAIVQQIQILFFSWEDA